MRTTPAPKPLRVQSAPAPCTSDHAIVTRLAGLLATLLIATATSFASADEALRFTQLPPLPDPLGVAGPLAGSLETAYGNVLIVAGGANFPRPVWEHDKKWRRTVHVMMPAPNQSLGYRWTKSPDLETPCAYASCASSPRFVIAVGGNNADRVFRDSRVFQLKIDDKGRAAVVHSTKNIPPLPRPHVYGRAVYNASTRQLFVMGGQTGQELKTATAEVWRISLSKSHPPKATSDWKRIADLPAPRAFHMAAVTSDGRILVVGGRREVQGLPVFLKDAWLGSDDADGHWQWTAAASPPVPLMAGVCSAMPDGKVYVYGAATGANFGRADELKDKHPGFPRTVYAYSVANNTWTKAGSTPRTHVTTVAVPWGKNRQHCVIPSGEIRPRVRSPQIIEAALPAP